MFKTPTLARQFVPLSLAMAAAFAASTVSAAHAQNGNGSDPMVVHYAGESGSSSTTSNVTNSNSYSQSSNNKSGLGGFADAARRFTQVHHGAMPNPATMPYTGNDPVAARQAEHQNIINQMRRHGASEGRINSYREQTEDAPGTTYHMVGGLKMRDDGTNSHQALDNIIHNGVMNTPISTDPNHYAPGTYGYYKTHGATLNFADWLNSQRR